jgi:hypothetical protein
MDKIYIRNVKQSAVFLFANIKCKLIGEYLEDCFIISPIDEEESISLAMRSGFWENQRGTDYICKEIIENSTTTGIYPLYYAVNGNQFIEILSSLDIRHLRNETYLFPDIKEI